MEKKKKRESICVRMMEDVLSGGWWRPAVCRWQVEDSATTNAAGRKETTFRQSVLLALQLEQPVPGLGAFNQSRTPQFACTLHARSNKFEASTDCFLCVFFLGTE